MAKPIPKLGVSKDNRQMHYATGAVIKRSGKYLLIDRAIPPFGFACPAGHIDEGETPKQALVREVEEEVGLKIEKFEKISEEELNWNRCSLGTDTHYWYLFSCEVSGEVKRSRGETKSAGWFSVEEIKKLKSEKKLEPVWEYWFEKIGVI